MDAYLASLAASLTTGTTRPDWQRNDDLYYARMEQASAMMQPPRWLAALARRWSARANVSVPAPGRVRAV